MINNLEKDIFIFIVSPTLVLYISILSEFVFIIQENMVSSLGNFVIFYKSVTYLFTFYFEMQKAFYGTAFAYNGAITEKRHHIKTPLNTKVLVTITIVLLIFPDISVLLMRLKAPIVQYRT